jgi:signal transduction histidine kinase
VRSAFRDISIRVRLAVLTGGIIAAVVLGHSIQALVSEAVSIQEEIALETRLVLVSLAGSVGSLWTSDQAPDLEPFARYFEGKLELRSLALLSPDGKVVTHHGHRPTPEEVRMVTRLRLRTVPRTLWGLGTGPIEMVIATPVLRGDTVRGYLLCAVRTDEAAQRLGDLVTRSILEASLWIALSAGLMLWVTRRLTRPLTQLAGDLLHLGRGSYQLPREGRADAEIGVVQDRLLDLSAMLDAERSQVADLTGQLHHQINVISAGLEARAAELSAVLDSTRDAVLVVREDGQVLRINEPASRFFGDEIDEPLWERVEDPVALRRAIEHACATQSPTLVHTRIRSDGQQDRPHLRVRVTPLRQAGQAQDALVVVAEDLSASRQLIEHMMRSERLASMGTLTGGMAHQLGNHLNAVKGYAELLARRLRGGEDRVTSDLEAIAREVRAAGALLKRTQELARTRAATRLEFTLGEILRGVRETALPAASSQGVEIRLEIPEEDLPLEGDPELLGEALLNLAMNGIHAMPEGGELRLRAAQDGRRAVVSVEDEGEGISEDDCSRIFDPFFTTKPTGEGTGLGLAIAQRIVELHGGDIDVRSRIGEGTTFEVLLPLQRGEVADRAVTEHTPETNPGARS